jgi:hypothetical protein
MRRAGRIEDAGVHGVDYPTRSRDSRAKIQSGQARAACRGPITEIAGREALDAEQPAVAREDRVHPQRGSPFLLLAAAVVQQTRVDRAHRCSSYCKKGGECVQCEPDKTDRTLIPVCAGGDQPWSESARE